jgi:hypothetical protein
MADGQSVDISRLIDEQGITRFNIRLIIFAMHISIERLFLVAAIPFAVGAVACYALTQLHVARFQASGLGQPAALDGANAKGA